MDIIVKKDTFSEKKTSYKAFYCILFGFLILLIPLIIALNSSEKADENEEKINDCPIIKCPKLKPIGTLEKMLKPIMENTNIDNGTCLSYALYYLDYFNNTNYKLDVRKINLAGVCPIGTKECGEDEGMPHTYLIINGYGGECILDQHMLVCIQLKDEI